MAQSHIRRHTTVIAVFMAVWFIGLTAIDHEQRVDHEWRKELARRTIIATQLLESLGSTRIEPVLHHIGANARTSNVLDVASNIKSNEKGTLVEEDGTFKGLSGLPGSPAFSVTQLDTPDQRSCRVVLGCWGALFAAMAAGLVGLLTMLGNGIARKTRSVGYILVVLAVLLPLAAGGIGWSIVASTEAECYSWKRATLMQETLIFTEDIIHALRVSKWPAQQTQVALASLGDVLSKNALVLSTNDEAASRIPEELVPTVEMDGAFSAWVGVRRYSSYLSGHLLYNATLDDTKHPAADKSLAVVMVGIAVVCIVGLSVFPYPKLGVVASRLADEISPVFALTKMVHLMVLGAALVAAVGAVVVDMRRSYHSTNDIRTIFSKIHALQAEQDEVAKKRLSVANGLATGTDWSAGALDYAEYPVVDTTSVATLATFYDEAKTIRSRVEVDALSLVVQQQLAPTPMSFAQDATIIAAISAVKKPFHLVDNLNATVELMETQLQSFLFHGNDTLFSAQHEASFDTMKSLVNDLEVTAANAITTAISTKFASMSSLLQVAQKMRSQTTSMNEVKNFYGTAVAIANLALEQDIANNISAQQTKVRQDLQNTDRLVTPEGYLELVISSAAAMCFTTISLITFYIIGEAVTTTLTFSPDGRGYHSSSMARVLQSCTTQMWKSTRSLSRLAFLTFVLVLSGMLVSRQQSLADVVVQQRRHAETIDELASVTILRDLVSNTSDALSLAIMGFLTEQDLWISRAAEAEERLTMLQNALLVSDFKAFNGTVVEQSLAALNTAAKNIAAVNAQSMARVALSGSQFSELSTVFETAAQDVMAHATAVSACSANAGRQLVVGFRMAFDGIKSNATTWMVPVSAGKAAIQPAALKGSITLTPACDVVVDAASVRVSAIIDEASGYVATSKRYPSLEDAVNVIGIASTQLTNEALPALLALVTELSNGERVMTNAAYAAFWAPILFAWATLPIVWGMKSSAEHVSGTSSFSC